MSARPRRLIAALSAALAAGALTVAVLPGGGAGASTPGPVVSALSTHSVPYWGDVPVMVSGANFVNVRDVLVGGVSVDGFAVLSSSHIRISEAEHANGNTYVQVVTASGTNRIGAAGLLTYRNPTGSDPINGGWTVNGEIALGQRFMATAAQRESVPRAPNAAAWNIDIGRTAVRRALAWKGMPYSFAGGNTTGPTLGACDTSQGLAGALDCHVTGFDCSGLVMYAWGPYVSLPHFAASQYQMGGAFRPTLDQLMPGDLLFFGSPSEGIGHVVIYEGRGATVEARMSGYPVLESTLSTVLTFGFMGTVRPKTSTRQAPPPSIYAVASQLPTSGGWVNVGVHNVDRLASLMFAGQRLYDYKLLNDHVIAVKLPAHAAGAGTLSVSTAWGTSNVVHVGFVAPAAVTAITPNSGPTTGSSVINVLGSGFTGTSQVLVGGVKALDFRVASPTWLRVRVPAHAAGAANLTVTTPYGTVSTSTLRFTYVAPAAPRVVRKAAPTRPATTRPATTRPTAPGSSRPVSTTRPSGPSSGTAAPGGSSSGGSSPGTSAPASPTPSAPPWTPTSPAGGPTGTATTGPSTAATTGPSTAATTGSGG